MKTFLLNIIIQKCCYQSRFYHVNLGGAKKKVGCMPGKPLHNTKQYINCTVTVTNGPRKLLVKAVPTAVSQQQSSNTLPLLHLAISGALSGSKTIHSASFTAFKKT